MVRHARLTEVDFRCAPKLITAEFWSDEAADCSRTKKAFTPFLSSSAGSGESRARVCHLTRTAQTESCLLTRWRSSGARGRHSRMSHTADMITMSVYVA